MSTNSQVAEAFGTRAGTAESIRGSRGDTRARTGAGQADGAEGEVGAWARALVGTEGGSAMTVLRLTLAAVMFPHGAQKLLGWFGGYGFEGTMGFLTGGVGLPAALAALVILIEFFAPIALAVGFLSRAAALGIAAVMAGAIVTTHLPVGFFMNWSGAQGGEGFEFHLLVLGMAAALMIRGSGALSVDRWLSRSRAA